MTYPWLWAAAIVGTLAACSTPPPAQDPAPQPVVAPRPAAAVIERAASRWVAVDWTDLPGWPDQAFHDAWNAWLRSCERPAAGWVALCAELRPLAIADAARQRQWIEQRLTPYRVEPRDAAADAGLLTGYFEPVFDARRRADAAHSVALHRPPAALTRPWFTRQEIDTLPQAQAALRGQEIAWLADPLDALMLHIQGSGRLRLTEPDGRVRMVRVAFAATNEQPYRSVGQWLAQQGERDLGWSGIRAWAARHPQRVNELLWSNPRYVFFREEPLSDLDAAFGPRGAQGVALTPGRSIAVDPRSIPYGAPVWLVSDGAAAPLRRLVLAQDTGAAIVGAVRADYFAGWGPQAGELASRLKQPLAMWVLWPRGPAP